MEMRFDSLKYRYPSRRNTIFAQEGICCSVSPIGSQIGVEILRRGGNAVDAAIAMAAAMPLLEPTGNSIGSDCFMIAWVDGKLYGLDGSGVSPFWNTISIFDQTLAFFELILYANA